MPPIVTPEQHPTDKREQDETRIRDRFVDLLRCFFRFRYYYQSKIPSDIDLHIDPALLYIAVVSYFDDIDRFKRYHLEEPERLKADEVKQAAFIVKWISRTKPVYVHRGLDLKSKNFPLNKDDTSALINEGFAISVVIAHPLGRSDWADGGVV